MLHSFRWISVHIVVPWVCENLSNGSSKFVSGQFLVRHTNSKAFLFNDFHVYVLIIKNRNSDNRLCEMDSFNGVYFVCRKYSKEIQMLSMWCIQKCNEPPCVMNILTFSCAKILWCGNEGRTITSDALCEGISMCSRVWKIMRIFGYSLKALITAFVWICGTFALESIAT